MRHLLFMIHLIMLAAGAVAQEKTLFTVDCPNCYQDPIDEKKILNHSGNGIIYSSLFNPDSYSEPSAIVTTDRICCFDCTLAGLYKIAFLNKMKGPDDSYQFFVQANRVR